MCYYIYTDANANKMQHKYVFYFISTQLRTTLRNYYAEFII